MFSLRRVQIRNFRLLADVELAFEDGTTVVVGRNNTGKTSLSEVIRRLLGDSKPVFQLEDFSHISHNHFCDALEAWISDPEERTVRPLIPKIEVMLWFSYDPKQANLGALSEFIVDLNPDRHEVLVAIQHELSDGSMESLFEGHTGAGPIDKQAFFHSLRERIPKMFVTNFWAQDPDDETNRKPITQQMLRRAMRTDFINAQRGLDDATSRETDVLARILEGLFATATTSNADAHDQSIVKQLHEAVKNIEARLDGDFNRHLDDLMPTLKTFGYPGLGTQELRTQTTLDVERLLSNHTQVRYASDNGVALPESYNGLGVRNLIFILLQLVRFYRSLRAEVNPPTIHLVFIEEPEAHLHPQMQEVFIRQLSKIAQHLSKGEPGGEQEPWQVQFVVSTHSSHIANEISFEAIRYFLVKPATDANLLATEIKDLRSGLSKTPADDRQFLHRYLTLTRCDLFFADKAILVEGPTERLLLPAMIGKLEETDPDAPKLSSQYLTVIEVGGAYAHIFFPLLDFLELRSLIVTDLDSVSEDGKACPVHRGTATSNACLRSWFGESDISPETLISKLDSDKIQGYKHIVFQTPEQSDGPCGRTFEDAFMLANIDKFGVDGASPEEQESRAYDKVRKLTKTSFALKYAIEDTDWNTPKYITDGLRWLAAHDQIVPTGADKTGAPPEPVVVGIATTDRGADSD